MTSKRLLFLFLCGLITACSHFSNDPDRSVAQDRHGRSHRSDGSEEGVYVTRNIQNNSGRIGVFNEFALIREYYGKNLKGVLFEVLPFGSFDRRNQISIAVKLNNREIENHKVVLRQGRQHFYTDVNLEIGDELRQLSLEYNPREASVQSVTLLLNDDRIGDGRGRDDAFVHTQVFPQVSRRRGGDYYDVVIPQFMKARFLVLEAQGFPVAIHEVEVDGMRVPAPVGTLNPGTPFQIEINQRGDEVRSIRIRAEGYTHDSVALRVQVGARPIVVVTPQPAPFPVPVPLPPHNPGPGPFPGPNRPGPGPGPFPGPNRPGNRGPTNDVRAFTDDNCRNLIGSISERDNCQQLNAVYGRNNVWSVSVNDKCINSADRGFVQSCESLSALSALPKPSLPAVVETYSDDNCKNSIIGIDPEFNCQVYAPFLSSYKVWSVKVEDRCVNTPDAAFTAGLCDQFRDSALSMRAPDRGGRGGRGGGEEIQFYTDDHCTVLLTDVQRGDNCSALDTFFRGQKIWSIRFRGRCENISDTTFKPACDLYAR
jgi:hypothetical protein